MNCPICRNEMKQGAIRSQRTVLFEELETGGAALAADGARVTLTRENAYSPNCPAWCCPRCKKVLVDYAETPQKWTKNLF